MQSKHTVTNGKHCQKMISLYKILYTVDHMKTDQEVKAAVTEKILQVEFFQQQTKYAKIDFHCKTAGLG